MDTVDDLKAQLAQKERDLVLARLDVLDHRINTLKDKSIDAELRLRVVEASRIRFETIAWLAFGGGLISVLNIATTLLK